MKRIGCIVAFVSACAILLMPTLAGANAEYASGNSTDNETTIGPPRFDNKIASVLRKCPMSQWQGGKDGSDALSKVSSSPTPATVAELDHASMSIDSFSPWLRTPEQNMPARQQKGYEEWNGHYGMFTCNWAAGSRAQPTKYLVTVSGVYRYASSCKQGFATLDAKGCGIPANVTTSVTLDDPGTTESPFGLADAACTTPLHFAARPTGNELEVDLWVEFVRRFGLNDAQTIFDWHYNAQGNPVWPTAWAPTGYLTETGRPGISQAAYEGKAVVTSVTEKPGQDVWSSPRVSTTQVNWLPDRYQDNPFFREARDMSSVPSGQVLNQPTRRVFQPTDRWMQVQLGIGDTRSQCGAPWGSICTKWKPANPDAFGNCSADSGTGPNSHVYTSIIKTYWEGPIYVVPNDYGYLEADNRGSLTIKIEKLDGQLDGQPGWFRLDWRKSLLVIAGLGVLLMIIGPQVLRRRALARESAAGIPPTENEQQQQP